MGYLFSGGKMEDLAWKILLSLSGSLFGTFSLFILVSIVVESWMTGAPAFPKDLLTPPSDSPFEKVAFPSSDGITLRGWFFPPPKPNGPVIIYAHGSGRDLREGLPLVPLFQKAGLGLLLFSYRNHGFSDRTSNGHTYGLKESEDLDAAVQFLKSIGYKSIALMGYSLGAASAIMSAARNPEVKAVVAIAPFASAFDLWFSNSPPFIPRPLLYVTLWLTEKRKGIKLAAISPEKAMKYIAPRPILLIQGTKDSYIPPAHTRRLMEAAGAGARLLLLDGADHKSVFLPGVIKKQELIIGFLREALH